MNRFVFLEKITVISSNLSQSFNGGCLVNDQFISSSILIIHLY